MASSKRSTGSQVSKNKDVDLSLYALPNTQEPASPAKGNLAPEYDALKIPSILNGLGRDVERAKDERESLRKNVDSLDEHLQQTRRAILAKATYDDLTKAVEFMEGRVNVELEKRDDQIDLLKKDVALRARLTELEDAKKELSNSIRLAEEEMEVKSVKLRIEVDSLRGRFDDVKEELQSDMQAQKSETDGLRIHLEGLSESHKGLSGRVDDIAIRLGDVASDLQQAIERLDSSFNRRFNDLSDRLGMRLTDIGKRVEDNAQHISLVEHDMKRNFDGMESKINERFTSLRERITERFTDIEDKLAHKAEVKELSDRVTALTEALEYQKETAAATIEAQNDVIDNLKKDFEAKISEAKSYSESVAPENVASAEELSKKSVGLNVVEALKQQMKQSMVAIQSQVERQKAEAEREAQNMAQQKESISSAQLEWQEAMEARTRSLMSQTESLRAEMDGMRDVLECRIAEIVDDNARKLNYLNEKMKEDTDEKFRKLQRDTGEKIDEKISRSRSLYDEKFKKINLALQEYKDKLEMLEKETQQGPEALMADLQIMRSDIEEVQTKLQDCIRTEDLSRAKKIIDEGMGSLRKALMELEESNHKKVEKAEFNSTSSSLRRNVADTKAEFHHKLTEQAKQLGHILERKAEEKALIAVAKRLLAVEGSLKPLNSSVNWIEGSLPFKAEKNEMEPVKEQVEELLQAIPELEKRHDELEKKHYELDKATKPSPRKKPSAAPTITVTKTKIQQQCLFCDSVAMYAEVEQPSPNRQQRPVTSEGALYRRFIVAAPPSTKRSRAAINSSHGEAHEESGVLSARDRRQPPSARHLRPSTTAGRLRAARSTNAQPSEESGGWRVLPLLGANQDKVDSTPSKPAAQTSKSSSAQKATGALSTGVFAATEMENSSRRLESSFSGWKGDQNPTTSQSQKRPSSSVQGGGNTPKNSTPLSPSRPGYYSSDSRPALRDLGDGGQTAVEMVGSIVDPSQQRLQPSSTMKVKKLAV